MSVAGRRGSPSARSTAGAGSPWRGRRKCGTTPPPSPTPRLATRSATGSRGRTRAGSSWRYRSTGSWATPDDGDVDLSGIDLTTEVVRTERLVLRPYRPDDEDA